jgi:hypothetical protein
MSDPQTTFDRNDPAYKERCRMAAYIHDHGWVFDLPRNQEDNRAPRRYSKKSASGMAALTLEEAYALEKGNNDLVNSWIK